MNAQGRTRWAACGLRWGTGALLLALSTAACESFLDVNDNPNAPEHVGVEHTLPGVVAEFGHLVLGGEFRDWSSEWMQQFSWNDDTRPYSNVHHYELTNIDTQGPWNRTFSAQMNEQRNIMRATQGTEDHAYRGIAAFLHAWSYSILTDAFGPVPYTEAFDPTIEAPGYDDQRTVYEGIHEILAQAIADLERPSDRVPGANDLLFGGDMSAWLRTARTVQARLHMRLSNAPGESATDRAQHALQSLQGGITSNAQDADFVYPGGAGGRQPNWSWRDQGSNNRVASAFFVGLLQDNADPRLPLMIKEAWDMTVEVGEGQTRPRAGYVGHPNGADGQQDSTWSWLSENITEETLPYTWIGNAEARFLEAEARLILDGPSAADGSYRAGIRAHMEKLGVLPADIDGYLATRPALSDVANPLEEIMTQKYIANFLQYEAWNDWRRTGYPRLEPVSSEWIDGMPNRMRTPASEMAYNAANVSATGISTGLVGMLTPVWWAEAAYPQW